MKELFLQYAAYNLWANRQLLDILDTLTPEQQHQEITSSFNSLYKTVQHVWFAESLWLQRIRKIPAVVPVDNFNGSMQELSAALTELDRQWEPAVEKLKEEQLSEIIAYTNIRGIAYQVRLDKLLLHIFNHSTYHRGQLVTMLRQAGVTKIPSTDFSAWVTQPVSSPISAG
jgi:uncharacterized damage-inducible protein DinB